MSFFKNRRFQSGVNCWMLILASFGFGAGSAVLKLLLRDFPEAGSLDLVQLRLAFSGLCLLLLDACRQRAFFPLRGRDVRRLAALGICGIFVVQFFLMYAVSKIYVGLATFTQATATLMICAYSVLILKEPLGRRKGAALLIGFVGLAVILWSPEMLRGEGLAAVGVLAALISAAGKCFYILYGKVLQNDYSSMTMVGYAMLFASAFALIRARPWRIFARYGPAPELLALLAVYIVLCTALPFALYFEGLKRTPVSIAGITNIMEPVGGTVMAFFLTHETLEPAQYAGILLIVLGVLLAQADFSRGSRTEGDCR